LYLKLEGGTDFMSQIKGSALIEVFDAKTNKKLYEQKEDNIITHAYEKILQDYRGKLGYSMEDMFANTDSIVHALFGGIMLFGSVIPSDANHMLPTDAEMQSFVGCASCQGKVTGNSYAGEFSADESEFTDDHAKFVYNFNTAEANGVISTICLTSAVGGYTGYKQAVQHENASERSIIQPGMGSDGMFNSLERSSSSYYKPTNGFKVGDIEDEAIICNPTKTLFHYYDGSDACKEINLQKEITRKILLNKIDQTVIPANKLSDIDALTNSVNTPLLSLDADKLYWLSTAGYSTPLRSTLTLHYISMSEPESTKTYNIASLYASVTQFYGDDWYEFYLRCCIYNGKFYMYVYNDSDKTKGRIYVVDLDESSNDCPFVYSDFTVTQLMMNGTDTPTALDVARFIRVNDTLYMSGDLSNYNYAKHFFRVDPTTGAVDTDSSTFVHSQTVQSMSTTNDFGKTGIFETYDNLFWVSQYSKDDYEVAGLHLPSGYLASINNLQNAINKTADRTLKVTYTLTYA
jgi:hypothetical protein